jgi:hypothetical protein
MKLIHVCSDIVDRISASDGNGPHEPLAPLRVARLCLAYTSTATDPVIHVLSDTCIQ